jgi:hypothetical protein
VQQQHIRIEIEEEEVKIETEENAILEKENVRSSLVRRVNRLFGISDKTFCVM